MDWKALRKAEDQLDKAFSKFSEAKDSGSEKKIASHKDKVIEAVNEWYELRESEA